MYIYAICIWYVSIHSSDTYVKMMPWFARASQHSAVYLCKYSKSNWRSMFASVCVHVYGRVRRSFWWFLIIEWELQKLPAKWLARCLSRMKVLECCNVKKTEIYIIHSILYYDVTYARVIPMREIGCCVFLWISYLLSPMVYTGHRFKKRTFNLLRFKPRENKIVKKN